MNQILSIICSLMLALAPGIWSVKDQSPVRIPGPGGASAVIATTPSFVQAATNDKNSAGAADIAATFGSGTASGNGVAVYVFWSESGTTVPATGDISDSSSDTFTYVNKCYLTGGGACAMYLATTVTAGTTAITFKCSTNTGTLSCNGYEGIVIMEIHGGSRVSDGSAGLNDHAGSTSTNGDPCAAVTTATDGDLILFGATDYYSNSTTFTAGTSPLVGTVPTGGRSANLLATMEYGTQATHGSITPTFTGNSSSNNYMGVCMAVK